MYTHIDQFQMRFSKGLESHVNYIVIRVNDESTHIDRSLKNLNIEDGTFPGSSELESIVDEVKLTLENENLGSILVHSRRLEMAKVAKDEVGNFTSVLNLFVLILNLIALLLIVNVQIIVLIVKIVLM